MLTKQAMEFIDLGTGGSYSLARDAIKHQIWDTRTFGATVSDFTFFTQPQGAAWRIGVKSLNETNLLASGQFPNGQTFLMTRMSLALIPAYQVANTDAADISQAFTNIMQSSVFEVVIAGRDFDFQVHGAQFMPRPICLNGETGANNSHVRVGDMISSGWIKFDPAPIFVDQLVTFSVRHRLNNPDTNVLTILNANCTTLNGIYATMQIVIEGFLTRAK